MRGARPGGAAAAASDRASAWRATASSSTIEADLVVCATGRAAQVPAWLDDLGSRSRGTSASRSTSRTPAAGCAWPADALGGDRMVIVGARPGRAARARVLRAGERRLDPDRRRVRSRPPAAGRRAGFLEFAGHRRAGRRRAAIREAEPLGPIATHGFPASRRWRYDRLDRLPGRAARHRRRHRVLQPALRAGHDRGRRPRRGAARVPAQGRRARWRGASSPPPGSRRTTPGASPPAPISRCRRSAAVARCPCAPSTATCAVSTPSPSTTRGRRRVHEGRDHARASPARAPPRARAPRRARFSSRAARTR